MDRTAFHGRTAQFAISKWQGADGHGHGGDSGSGQHGDQQRSGLRRAPHAAAMIATELTCTDGDNCS